MTTNTPNTRAFRFASTLIACVFALSTPTAPALAQPAPPPGPTFEPARDAPFTSPTEITLYVKYYYLNPNPLRIGHAVDFLSANAVGIEEPRALVPAHAALGRLLRTAPDRIERWLRTTMSRDAPESVLIAATCACTATRDAHRGTTACRRATRDSAAAIATAATGNGRNADTLTTG